MKTVPALSRVFSAFSMVEILGGCAILMVVAGVATISVKDTLVAGQRSTIQRELQQLNTAMGNLRSAGADVTGVDSTDAALDVLRVGVQLGDGSTFKPLTGEPEREKTVGGSTFRLGYNPETGFYYSDGLQEFAGSGETSEPGDQLRDALRFDPTNPDSIRDALLRMVSMNPEDPEYGVLVLDLNRALDARQLDPARWSTEIADAGLVLYRDDLMSRDIYRVTLANEAADLLAQGNSWDSLSAAHQQALAELYPDNVGGG